MLDYAEHIFRLKKRDKDGVSEEDHLKQVERQTGITPEGLIGPEFPHLLSNCWSAFLDLNRTRSSGMNGSKPITYTEMVSWKEMTGNNLTPKEVELLTKLDSVYLEVMNG